VHACENPAVLRRAAGDLGPAARPLICTEGQPSTAFHRLAAAITSADGALRYHGDFDWPGVGIAASIIDRHHATPWRFAAPDYEAAIKADADHVRLAGSGRPTPWDPGLEETMTAHGRAVYEEAVAATLVADLKS